MYRVIVIIGGALTLAACSSTPDWLSTFKPTPVLDTVRFESTPPGADAKTSNGQSCRTPCALALPTDAPLSVTFTLNGYLPDTETLDPVNITGSPTSMQPNPVVAELEPAPPPPKPMKPVRKPAPKKKTTAKPAAAKPVAAKPAPAPVMAAPAQPPEASPWPAPPPPPAQPR
jgi:hypothetical protein